MAGDRRQRRGRAAEREAADEQVRRIYLGSAAVLVLAALAVLAGLYFTRYVPPRAHVLTADGERYQARDIVDRGIYRVFVEGGVPSISDVARGTIDQLVKEAALRSQGPSAVEAVTDADIEFELLIELGLITEPVLVDVSDAGAEDGDATATPEATTSATETATPEASIDPQEFADALTEHLREIDLDRETFEAIIEARLYRERLRDRFEAEVGSSGAQVSLKRIRTSTPLAAETVLEAFAGGAEWAALVAEHSVAEGDGEEGDLGWSALELLDEEVRAAIEGLGAGEVSAVIPSGVFFDVYLVSETAADREYEDGVATRLASQLLDEWLETATAAIEVDRDMSADEESWINDRIQERVIARVGG